MNADRAVAVGLGVALLGANVYWRRRERTVRESLITSREEQADAEGGSEELARLARMLDADPEDVPSEVRALETRLEKKVDQVAALSTELGEVRRRWAMLVAETLVTPRLGPDEPQVVVLTLAGGTTEDTKALGKVLIERRQWVGIVIAEAAGTFTVTVGEELRETVAANDLAERIADRAGGGAGGSTQIANGGGDADALRDAAEELEAELTTREPFVEES